MARPVPSKPLFVGVGARHSHRCRHRVPSRASGLNVCQRPASLIPCDGSLEIYSRHRRLWQGFFLLTGDPLAWIADRGEAGASVTVDDEVLEVDIYVRRCDRPRRRRKGLCPAHDGEAPARDDPCPCGSATKYTRCDGA